MSRRAALPFEPGVAGVDEAGRGALAGPVAVAAVILPEGFDAAGVVDSKKLTPEQREAQFERICAEALFSIQLISEQVIDEINILQATFRGMRQAAQALEAAHVLIDGNAAPPGLVCETLVKGDGKRAEIAAASILAKVSRDRWMIEAHDRWPQYGFAEHKGYAAPEHLAVIRDHGPCPIHRRSFDPVRSMLAQPCLIDEF